MKDTKKIIFGSKLYYMSRFIQAFLNTSYSENEINGAMSDFEKGNMKNIKNFIKKYIKNEYTFMKINDLLNAAEVAMGL